MSPSNNRPFGNFIGGMFNKISNMSTKRGLPTKEGETTKLPFQMQLKSLSDAMARKGGPGTILLSIITFLPWALIFMVFGAFFWKIPFENIIEKEAYWAVIIISMVLLAGLIVLFKIAYLLNKLVVESIEPTLIAEATAAKLMPQAFGGRMTTIEGKLAVTQLDPETAKRRTLRIMGALISRAATIFKISNTEKIRANIFILSDDEWWLEIANGFHLNMKGGTLGDSELNIKIPNGFLSSGTAYKYFRPTLSEERIDEAGNSQWDNMPSPEVISKCGLSSGEYIDWDSYTAAVAQEITKAHPDLKWIVTMPIPYQVQPFKMTCGVMNVDGLEKLPRGAQTEKLLIDASTAAALIGVINRTTDLLNSKCYRCITIPEDIQDNVDCRLESVFGIDPDKFDPATCPEPSIEFTRALSDIPGLEFFKEITPTQVAEFLRDQLRSY